MQTNRIMLDLETKGRAPGCGILSIGAVEFNLRGDIFNEFYLSIDPEDNPAFYGTDPETIKWWNRQDAWIRAEAFSGTLTHKDALTGLHNYIQQRGPNLEVFANHSAFDFPILRYAFKKEEIPCPWKYWQEQDYATLKLQLAKRVQGPARTTRMHNALEDAKYQAKHCINLLRFLN